MIKSDALIKYPDRVDVIGVPISAVNMSECLEFINLNFDYLRGGYICASNVHTTVMAHEQVEYMKVQSESILSIPDGKPLSVVGKKGGYKNMEKVTGTHFMQNTFCDERFKGKKHFFYGTTTEVLDKMLDNMKHKYHDLNICGYEPSIFRPLSDEEVMELAGRINESEADFIWMGIGAPRQEFLMNRLKGQVGGIMTGVGGAFNIIAGIVNDAPMWMQNLGLEWLYRLLKEPKRLFKRYFITNTKFLIYLFLNSREK